MARKRNRRPRRATKPKAKMLWSYTDRLEMWAYLNWCVQYGENFENTAIDHLQKATGKTFSYQQIRNKMRGEWTIHGTCNTFDELFSQGTAGLYPFGEKEQERFQQILSKLDPPRQGRWLRSTSTAATARSRTVSESRVTSIRETHAPSPPERDAPKEFTKRSRRKTKQKATLKSTQPKTISLSEDELAMDEDPGELESQAESDLSTISSSKFSDVELNFGHTIPDSQEERMPDRPKTRPTTSLETSLHNAQEELLKKNGAVITLMNQVSGLKKELELLHQSVRAVDFNQVSWEREREITNLKRKLQSQDYLIRDFDALETDSLAFPTTSLKSEYNKLYLNIDNTSFIICSISTNDDLPEQQTSVSQLCQSWAMTVHGGDMASLLELAQGVRIPKAKLVASLLTAGIFELVLKSAFPEILAVESPLLDQYRKQIVGLGGTELLQKLELAAIKSLFSDDHVRKGVISERANSLCSIMLQSLNCFIPSASHDMAEQLPSSLTEEEAMAIDGLKSNLSEALDMKLELVLSVKRFKYLFFRPGTLFDNETMRCDITQIGQAIQSNERIKLCMFPALFSVSHEKQEDIEADFSPNYNQDLTEATTNDVRSLVLVAKARILL